MSERILGGGRYVLREVLGRGGMAVVWLAFDQRLGRPVAVKMLDGAAVLDTTARERFDREARTAAALSHPNIVAVHDVGLDRGVPYLVMELIDGISLASVLLEGPLHTDDAVTVAVQVCSALQAAHAAGVVHRDIKPGNIMISGDDVVKVCDFGIAHLTNATDTLTSSRSAIGTSLYMAPEQISGGAQVDARADLYSLGCLMYAMFTGAPPFEADTPANIAFRQLHQPPVPLEARRPDLPRHVTSLVNQLLAKDPADRPSSASLVAQRLRDPSSERVDPPTVLVPTGAYKTVRSNTLRWALIGAGGALVLVIGVCLWFLNPGSSPTMESPQGQDPGPTEQSSVPQPSETASPSASTSAAAVRAGSVAAVRAVIQAQVSAGGLNADVARELNSRLDEIARHLSKGQTKQARDKIGVMRQQLAALRQDNKLTPEAYTTILASLNTLPTS